jgi:hypothetical protein
MKITIVGTLRGLLGDFDEDPNNDLRSPTEELLEPNSTAEEIYYNFGLPCNYFSITFIFHIYTYHQTV